MFQLINVQLMFSCEFLHDEKIDMIVDGINPNFTSLTPIFANTVPPAQKNIQQSKNLGNNKTLPHHYET